MPPRAYSKQQKVFVAAVKYYPTRLSSRLMPRSTKRPADTAPSDHLEPDVPAQYTLNEEQPYAPDFGIRLAARDPQTRGYRDYCQIRPGFAALIGDMEHGSEHSDTRVGDDVVKFHFRYKGTSEIGAAGQDVLPVEPMTFGILIQPPEVEKVEHFFAKQHELSVTLMCNASFINDILQSASLPVPAPLKDFLNEKVTEIFYSAVRMRPEMTRAVKAIFESRYQGRLQQLHIEAQALDLLCQTLDLLSEMWGDKSQNAQPLRRRDLQRIADVCELLENNLSEPLTIRELARTVNWNETQLMRSFRQAVGMTVHNYLNRARMERARELLTATDLTVTQIAFEVGYEYASNFTTAFRRYFEHTPKQIRDRRMLRSDNP
jgi:AraC-like DNA-binding protein